jgi:protein SCO1/2
MKKSNKKINYRILRKVILPILILAFTSCKTERNVNKTTILPFFNSGKLTPEWITKDSLEYNNIHTIPDFNLINQEGNVITKRDYDGRIYIADFFFASCPGICPILEKI